MSKHRESDNEIQTYIDECMRLRTLLEQTMIQNDAFAAQQNNLAAAEDGVQEDQARLQEALYAQEAQLSQEREVKGNLQVAVMNEKEEKNRLLDRLKLVEAKAKKHNEAVAEAKRKQKIINEKNGQLDHLQEQLAGAKGKAEAAEKVYSQNRDLVTRKCGLESALQARDKKIGELSDRVGELEAVVRALETQAVAPSLTVHSGPAKAAPKKATTHLSSKNEQRQEPVK